MTATIVQLRQVLSGARCVRVLVVDDSVVMRRMLSNMLEEMPQVEVVGVARDGVEGLRKVAQLQPDLVLLDVEMPGPNGIEILRKIRKDHAQVRVIMCSSLTIRGSQTTMDALLAGADDFVTKQSSGHVLTNAQDALRLDLEERIQRLFRRTPQQPPSKIPALALAPSTKQFRAVTAVEILAIGVSTGGPALLARLLPLLPADFRLPVVIVQHMPPFFTQLLAERLNKVCALQVREAEEGARVAPGTILLAPGDFHMRIARDAAGYVIRLDQGEREQSCRPAVDVLFRSVAEHFGDRALAVVLTGMGEDGLRGARVLREAGAELLAQDEQSSVVWGMPGAIAQAALASAVLPADEIIPEVLRRI